jgi:hypothetical protein
MVRARGREGIRAGGSQGRLLPITEKGGGRIEAELRPNGGRLETEWRPIGGRMGVGRQATKGGV